MAADDEVLEDEPAAGQMSWWGPMFASAFPESLMGRMGRIYLGRPVPVKSRGELLASVRANQRRFLRADTGDVAPASAPAPELVAN